MSNEHCLVFARATGLFPDPAQQFFLLCLFCGPLLRLHCLRRRGRTNAACFLFCIIAAALKALFAFAGRRRTISNINSKICGK